MISLELDSRGTFMNSQPDSSQRNFEPPIDLPIEFGLPTFAEDSVVQTIVEGSGGPGNAEITEPGLRFIRHLLSRSRPARHGFIPNFKDMDAIRSMAREFIRCCGGPSLAIQKMIAITACERY